MEVEVEVEDKSVMNKQRLGSWQVLWEMYGRILCMPSKLSCIWQPGEIPDRRIDAVVACSASGKRCSMHDETGKAGEAGVLVAW